MWAPQVAGTVALQDSKWPTATLSDVRQSFQKTGSKSWTICNEKGNGYFVGDPDIYRESLLYVNFN
jgi:hypothetical protein